MKSNMNIWFRCPSCEKKLVVSHEAAGYRSNCPECGENIPIPQKSTILSPSFRTFLFSMLHGVILVSCIAGGWYLAKRSSGEHVMPADSSAQTTGEANVRLSDDVPQAALSENTDPEDDTDGSVDQTLLNQHTALKGQYEQLLQWMMENYRGKYPLPESMVGRLRILPVGENNALNPELIELLGMSEREQGMVQDVFDYVRESLSIAELERAQISNQRDDSITITVPTYPELGQELRDDLYLSLESTLGVPRFDRMVDVSGEDMREQFNYFGEASRTLTFQVIYPEHEGQHDPYVLIRDGWVIPEGDSMRLTKVTETAINQLPDDYRDYESMLPPGVSQYAAP